MIVFLQSPDKTPDDSYLLGAKAAILTRTHNIYWNGDIRGASSIFPHKNPVGEREQSEKMGEIVGAPAMKRLEELVSTAECRNGIFSLRRIVFFGGGVEAKMRNWKCEFI